MSHLCQSRMPLAVQQATPCTAPQSQPHCAGTGGDPACRADRSVVTASLQELPRSGRGLLSAEGRAEGTCLSATLTYHVMQDAGVLSRAIAQGAGQNPAWRLMLWRLCISVS